MAVGQGLLSTSVLDDVPTKQPAMQDELELALGDVNSSGLIDRGFLDEMRRNDDDAGRPSGRF